MSNNIGNSENDDNQQQSVVLKFGGRSMGRPENNSDNLCHIAKVIRYYQRKYNHVMVVCSAFEGETDRLKARADSLLWSPESARYDRLLAQGEINAAQVLGDYLNGIQMQTAVMNNGNLPVRAIGSHGSGEISYINARAVRAELGAGKVAIIPGFVAYNPGGNLITIGRDGSDTSAIALAEWMRADSVCLFKDVNGISPANPKKVADARPYEELSNHDAQLLSKYGAGIVHLKGLEMAQKGCFDIHILPLDGAGSGTVISNDVSNRDIIGITYPNPKMLDGSGWMPVSVVGHRAAEYADVWRSALRAQNIHYTPEIGAAAEVAQLKIQNCDLDKILNASYPALFGSRSTAPAEIAIPAKTETPRRLLRGKYAAGLSPCSFARVYG